MKKRKREINEMIMKMKMTMKMKKQEEKEEDDSDGENLMTQKIYVAYSDSSIVLTLDLNEERVVLDLITSGKGFQRSGPWCLMDLWAISNFGLTK